MRNLYLGWHVLYVKSQHEKKINLTLKELDLESFLPLVSTIKQWTDRRNKILRPLFPCYVFINVRSKTEFHRALQVNGVFSYVRFGEKYAKIRSDEIFRIKNLLNLEGISEVNVISKAPCEGEMMTISCGPLNGVKCTVLRLNNKNKVFVRIESIRQNIMAVVPSAFLSRNL